MYSFSFNLCHQTQKIILLNFISTSSAMACPFFTMSLKGCDLGVLLLQYNFNYQGPNPSKAKNAALVLSVIEMFAFMFKMHFLDCSWTFNRMTVLKWTVCKVRSRKLSICIQRASDTILYMVGCTCMHRWGTGNHWATELREEFWKVKYTNILKDLVLTVGARTKSQWQTVLSLSGTYRHFKIFSILCEKRAKSSLIKSTRQTPTSR